MKDLIGARLGPYHLLEVIRESGMSTVYKAYQPSLDRPVAVKVMLYHQDPQFAARFKREAKAIGQLEHHNILPIYDYGEQDDLLYFVMQYVENGASLHTMMGAPIDGGRAIRMISQVLAGLDYAHGRGVIHRDIKPSNILTPLPNWPLLADFGLAKLANEKQSLTMPGLVMGTAAYIAPEQANGEPADARTDLYSVGVVLYEMLTGRVPFDAPTPMAMLKMHVYEPPPPPRSLNPNLSEAMEAVLLRALEKDPDARYQTAREMSEALRHMTGHIEHVQANAQHARLYEAGVQAFAEASWDRAIERLRQLVALEPHYEDAAELLRIAQDMQQQGRVAARQQLERVRQRRREQTATMRQAAADDSTRTTIQAGSMARVRRALLIGAIVLAVLAVVALVWFFLVPQL
ncbi:MAG TPA: serine/threonine-protein kinase [Roseiflexaceae bacterium]|jgi:serine/threonine protein kinase|nr:serine/threonine-protein kinase [Roseiflexaceae bacterium]